jgi:hypothetical protein
MSKALAFLKKEALEMLPPTVFFFVVFEWIVFTRSLMGSSQSNLTLTTTSGAILGGLILGKSILIADALPLFKWFGKKRLILNVLWRIVLYPWSSCSSCSRS